MNKDFKTLSPEERLAAIKKKFYRELPENKRERRLIPAMEIRAVDGGDDESPKLEGYAAVFDKDSDGLWFIERIRKGAFEETIKNDDVVGLFNHDRNYVLGRNTAGTMTLEEDDTGLRYVIDIPNTQMASDVYQNVKRGDVKGSSFSFVTEKDEWEYLDNDVVIRTLLKVRLFDVGPVTFPAYPDTTTAARSIEDWLKKQNDAREDVPWRRELARRNLELAAQ